MGATDGKHNWKGILKISYLGSGNGWYEQNDGFRSKKKGGESQKLCGVRKATKQNQDDSQSY